MRVVLRVAQFVGQRGLKLRANKMLDPFGGRSLRVVPVTHPDYLRRMEEVLGAQSGTAVLMRGSEGEPVAGPRRALSMECIHDGASFSLESGEFSPEAPLPASIEPGETADWIRRALEGKVPVPVPLRRQCDWIAACAMGEWPANEASDSRQRPALT